MLSWDVSALRALGGPGTMCLFESRVSVGGGVSKARGLALRSVRNSALLRVGTETVFELVARPV